MEFPRLRALSRSVEAASIVFTEGAMETEQKLHVTLSVAMKVNLGNYESADAFLSISNVSDETTEEEMVALLDGPARIAYDLLKGHLGSRVAALRSKS